MKALRAISALLHPRRTWVIRKHCRAWADYAIHQARLDYERLQR